MDLFSGFLPLFPAKVLGIKTPLMELSLALAYHYEATLLLYVFVNEME